MHDKQVRRRRAVLVLLVAVALILLSAYFGEAGGGPLHSVQRGIVTVLSPVQKGASTVLTPVRDVAGFFSSTFHAKTEVAQLKLRNQKLTQEVAQLKGAEIQNAQLSKLITLNQSIGVSAYRPVAAHVIGSDPSLWYDQIEVDAGSSSGVQPNQPVIGQDGLVGVVSDVTPGASWVTLITNHTIEVAAEVQDGVGDRGVLQPSVGNPNQLVLSDLPHQANIQTNQLVVTAGFRLGKLDDLYPPNIPIGTVSNANQVTLASSGQVQVTPTVDLRHLDVVEILTNPRPGTARASTVP
ncbi:MAG TPA: rod shape-determining protein MreC [Solirubrobacteraceae bacterium]|nr:rod shape-determining protein MreC [Solirubrobacteraceae bacterium]